MDTYALVRDLSSGRSSRVWLGGGAVVVRGRERALRLASLQASLSLADRADVLTTLCADYLAGDADGRGCGGEDLLRLAGVCRNARLAVLASPAWRLSPLLAYAPAQGTISAGRWGRFSRWNFARDLQRFTPGARRAWRALDLFGGGGCYVGGGGGAFAALRARGGADAASVQRAVADLGHALPAALVASLRLRCPAEAPWSAASATWGDGGDAAELEGSGGLALLPIESREEPPAQEARGAAQEGATASARGRGAASAPALGARRFDGFAGDLVATTLAFRRDGRLPVAGRAMVVVAISRSGQQSLWVDCGASSGPPAGAPADGMLAVFDDCDSDAGAVFVATRLSCHRVAPDFVSYLHSLLC